MTEQKKTCIAAGLVILSAAFLVMGVLRDEHTIVWVKAVNICMECIGLG